MIDEDIPCEDILMQINAAKSACTRPVRVVLEGICSIVCVTALNMGMWEKTIASFAKAVERFSNMI